MSINLKQMLEGATAIPYSDKLITILDEACSTYKSNDEFERVDELVVGFVTGIIPSEFKNHIKKVMEEQEFHEIPTNEVFVCLAQYVVLITILNNEDELNKSICASKLMNYMLVAKALKRSIPNVKSLVNVYQYHISKYLNHVDTTPIDIQTKIRSKIPKGTFPIQIPEEDADALRLVFKEAELYRIERLLTSEGVQNIENPFVRIYIGLSKMFSLLAYCFYNLDLNRIIDLLIGEKNEQECKRLNEIIEELTQSGYELKHDCSKTSVILLMIKGLNQNVTSDIMLSIKEFAVYLYYELLTEKIISTRN